MTKTTATSLLLLALMVGGARSASAQSKTFIFIPGIPGGSLDDRHQDWIDVLSMVQSWPGPAKRRPTCDVTILKQLDSAGPRLWAAAATEQVFTEVRIEVMKAGADPVKVYEIKLGNTKIGSISTSVASRFIFDFPTEEVLLSPQTATLTVFLQNPDGSPGGTVVSTIPCN